jgi:hypothetical protein
VMNLQVEQEAHPPHYAWGMLVVLFEVVVLKQLWGQIHPGTLLVPFIVFLPPLQYQVKPSGVPKKKNPCILFLHSFSPLL